MEENKEEVLQGDVIQNPVNSPLMNYDFAISGFNYKDSTSIKNFIEMYSNKQNETENDSTIFETKATAKVMMFLDEDVLSVECKDLNIHWKFTKEGELICRE